MTLMKDKTKAKINKGNFQKSRKVLAETEFWKGENHNFLTILESVQRSNANEKRKSDRLKREQLERGAHHGIKAILNGNYLF